MPVFATCGVPGAALPLDRGREWLGRERRLAATFEAQRLPMKTVVIIDNDASTRAILSEHLSGKGWRVVEADNGDTGLDLILKNQPAAVLCDIRAPKQNGFKVCQSIRSQGSLSRTRVILTTAGLFPNDRDLAFEAGADDYLCKPIESEKLLSAMEKAAQGDSPEPRPEARSVAAMPTRVRFWGVRGSIPVPGPATAFFGGNTSCVELRADGQVFILDAGSGIRGLGRALAKDYSGRNLAVTLFITHTHWDHIQGFPFFMPAYDAKAAVRIMGSKGAVYSLREALFEQMRSAFFPVSLNDMASHVTFEGLEEREFEIGDVKVRTILANHPGLCLGFRFSTSAGDVVYMPDHEGFARHEIERQRAAHENIPTAIAYAREQDEKVIHFWRNADVVIADSQYDSAEYPTRLGWGHSCIDDTLNLAMQAGVKHLFLFHHDPDHDDEKMKSIVSLAREQARKAGSTMNVDAAREGEEFVLDPSFQTQTETSHLTSASSKEAC
jgi:phosphoribosyl 1,2-cyclic phosphodiesterase/CheY-like chemotaxis protein